MGFRVLAYKCVLVSMEETSKSTGKKGRSRIRVTIFQPPCVCIADGNCLSSVDDRSPSHTIQPCRDQPDAQEVADLRCRRDVLRSLRFLLETEGFDVRTFRSGSALLGSSTRHSADCLVMDYKMAGIDGLELAQRLRGIDLNTPIVSTPE